MKVVACPPFYPCSSVAKCFCGCIYWVLGTGYCFLVAHVRAEERTRDGQAVGEFYATGKVPAMLERLQAAGYGLPAAMFTDRTFPVE